MEVTEEAEMNSIQSDNSEASSNYPVSESEQSTDTSGSYLFIPYGFQAKACYKPKSKSKEITGVTYNSRTRQFIMLDSKGITAWSYNSMVNSVSRLLEYPSYQFNIIRLLLHSKKFNVYFALTKDYALKVFNPNFHEVFSVDSDMNSILSMVFNSVTDELITGGTGGMKFWKFGEIKTKGNYPLIKLDSRRMANYGLILRCEHPAMGGSWVKDIILDERNQKLYCLAEGNVVAYDMQGNLLFQINSAHRGFVTGCVYSKFSNFVVTGGTDCLVNVFSPNGGCIHSFSSHSRVITNVLLHPEFPSLVITSSQDGSVKIFSLDIMEEIYSHMVFAEGIQWMNLISSDLLYCATSKGLQVFSINHIANFWTTIRCPIKSLSLSSSCDKTKRVVAIAQDSSTRLLSRSNNLLSTVLPPPLITTSAKHDKQFVCAHAYSPLYGLLYLLVDDKEIWVYYTKTNPANRVEVWQLSDVQDIINGQQRTQSHNPSRAISCSLTSEFSRPSTTYQRPSTSRSLYSSSKIVDGVSCLALAFLNSPIILKTEEGESCPDITHFLVAGLQDGRLLFLNPFSATLLYLQFQATKGAILSIQHDGSHNSLLLNTIKSNQFTIQIRSLPCLELLHQIDVGNDLKCFVRMDNTILSGHETGRLKLHHISKLYHNSISDEVMSDGETRKLSAKKLSKDHLDAVFSVDAHSGLQLFCSSSKDGYIKIWDNAKVLLREIVMDNSLTAACFLNSSGDLLVGFKNHIFCISHEKAHLSFYNKNTNARDNSGIFETESDVYEDPRIRYEFKKTPLPQPVSMETYLVPFANISVNLARYLSGNPPAALENQETSETDETDSELSDLFSVPPTELYMSQTGTPSSRSRSSSLASSWNLPNLGSSPVHSPPRTPPLVTTPLIVSESDSEEEGCRTKPDDLIPPEEKYEERRPVNFKGHKTEKLKPVFTMRSRTGLSQVKIDSRAIRSETNIHGNKRDDYENNTSGGHEGNAHGGHEGNTKAGVDRQELIQSNRIRRSPRAVVKKTKKSVLKTARSVKGRGTLKRNEPRNSDLVRSSTRSSNTNENGGRVKTMDTKNMQEIASENEVENKVKETIIGSVRGNQDQENTRGNSNAARARDEESRHEFKDVPPRQLSNEGGFQRKMDEIEEREFPNPENKASVVINTSVDELPSTTTYNPLPSNADDKKEIFDEKVVKRDNIFDAEPDITFPQLQKEVATFQDNPASVPTILPQKSQIIDGYSPEQRHSQEDSLCDDSDEPDITNEEHLTTEERTSSSCDSNAQTKSEVIKGKSASFNISGDLEKENKVGRVVKVCPPSPRITHKSGRRSISPVPPPPKVVPVSDRQFNDDDSDQRLHSNSALKIYALAKMYHESTPLVSRPRSARQSHVRHQTSQESTVRFDSWESRTDYLRNVADEKLKGIIGASGDERGTLWTTKTAEEKRGKVREKEDLVNWCINSLREKGKYPVFPHRPRLRSRRSMNLEKNEGKTDAVSLRVNNPDDEHRQVKNNIARDKDFKNRKSERACATSEDWFEGNPTIRCLSSSEMLRFKKTHEKQSRLSVVNVGEYSEGWQDRFLEKERALKEKRLERERRILDRRQADEHVLEEKRRSVLGHHEHTETELDNGERFAEACPQQEEDAKKRLSSFEDFKNNPQIFQPYRLRKFSSCTDEDRRLISTLQVDPETGYSADGIFELLPRPKSTPSIPSKCRKYMLVVTESADIRNKPVATPLEETLMVKRFPNSKLKPKLERTSSRIGLRRRRCRSVGQMQTSSIACE